MTRAQLFSLILLAIGVILGAVSVGIGQWSRLETIRTDDGVQDGATTKTVGLFDRCVSYVVTSEILELGLSLDQQPTVSHTHHIPLLAILNNGSTKGCVSRGDGLI